MSLRTLPADERGRRPRPPLTVELLPPEEAVDYEYVAFRLHDVSLLGAAVAVRVFRVPLLAVPVGGCRRGGRLNAGPLTIALAVHALLWDRPGFPKLQLTGCTIGEDWFVEWGEQPPRYPAKSPEERAFFGYASTTASPPCRVPAQRDGASGATALPTSEQHRRSDDAGTRPSGRDHR